MTAPPTGSAAPASGAASKRGRGDASAATPRLTAASLAERQGIVRRLVRPALVLITVVLVADALIGDKGLLEHRRQAKRREQIEQELTQRQRENQELRVRARRLREEHPATVEDLARRKLGMVKPGELLFVVRDAEAPAAPTKPASPPAR
jgi:cell division protein FtsB